MSEAWQLYISTLIILGGIYAMGCLGFNLQFGTAGVINLAFVLFVAAGAYTAAVLSLGAPSDDSYQRYFVGGSAPFPIPLIAAGAVGGGLALVIGLLTLRRLRRDYEAIVMLVVSIIALNVVTTYVGIFNGANGLSGIPKPLAGALQLSPYGLHYQWVYSGLVTACVVGTVFLVKRITYSPQGRVFRAVRENERAAAALGKNVTGVRLKAFVAGGVIAGVSGGLLAYFIGSWGPGNWGISVTFLYLVAVIVGGRGSLLGAIVGAILVPVLFIEVVRFIRLESPLVDPLRWIIVGLLVLGFLWFRPQGLVPERPTRRVDSSPRPSTRSSNTAGVEA